MCEMEHKKAYWFIFCKEDILLERNEDGVYTIPLEIEPPVKLFEWNLINQFTSLNDIPCKVVGIDTPFTDNKRYEMKGLRTSFDLLPFLFYQQAGKGAEILYWERNTKYCGVCGAPMKLHTEISKRCINCGKEVWPQLATAVIVLVRQKDKILLVHAHNFRGKHYGLVAGFVETGETLEECVVREVWEETHIRVKNIRYYASQPWPYPCGLMIGFIADYDGGELCLQRKELADGGWYGRDEFPELPGKVSLARMLIDAWLEGRV